MIHLGLIGYPLGHSLSPKIHQAALQACSLDGDYSLYPIQLDDKQGLGELLMRIRSGEIGGLNVTIPHKQNVIEFMDELTPTAQTIGAVNVIYMRDGKLIGDNTDAPGFLSDLANVLGDQSKIIDRKSAIVLGAGGSARAVVYALLNDGWQVTLAARKPEQAHQLAQSFSSYKLQISNFNVQPANFNLIVNTTPIGMIPNVDQSPLPEDAALSTGCVVYDLVYNPRETKLVRDVRAAGFQAETGLGMLIEQAALAFELWMGINPPREVMWNAVEN